MLPACCCLTLHQPPLVATKTVSYFPLSKVPFACGVSTEKDRAPVISVFVIYELADKCGRVSVIFSFCPPCIKGDNDKVLAVLAATLS